MKFAVNVGDNGIPYEPRSRFTPAEDDQIRKNWKRFAAKHNLDYELAASYAGVPGRRIIMEKEDRLEFNRKTAFWPNMCRDLPHRSACQVRQRIGVIFDAAVLKGQADLLYSKSALWTKKETKKLLKYYKEYGMSASAMYKIGKKMQRPTHSCQNHLRSVLARTGPVPDYLRRKLWIVVMKHSTKDEKPFERAVRRAIFHNRHEVLHDYDAYTKWDIVAQRMVFSLQLVREAWFRLLDDLQTKFNEKQQSSDSRRDAWSGSLKSVLDVVPPISCEDYSSFLKILSQETPEDATYDVLNRKLYDCEALKAKLEEEAIVGFYCGGSSELDYLFRKTRTILWRLHHLLFRRLKMQYTLKERTHILSLAYDYQCEFSPEEGQQNVENLGEHGERQRTRFKDLKLKHCGFPALRRGPFVEALVVYSKSHFDDWVPPTALKKYVVSEDVLAIFPEKRNNSELLKQKDLEAVVSFLDLDIDSEDTTQESDDAEDNASSNGSETLSDSKDSRQLRNAENGRDAEIVESGELLRAVCHSVKNGKSSVKNGKRSAVEKSKDEVTNPVDHVISKKKQKKKL
ncbi:hypothetical protein Y032_0691g1571 [Ancylostoma ceylanicum]|uniref:Myb-like domain-containing protein n=1 Tax=Ancylostoma ceylanicum TaxID=53326 RepID=A0A016WGS6_9BILA|nr:hypothetical protein Y032_0691g1571 [Ancylostoma ceylanicum]